MLTNIAKLENESKLPYNGQLKTYYFTFNPEVFAKPTLYATRMTTGFGYDVYVEKAKEIANFYKKPFQFKWWERSGYEFMTTIEPDSKESCEDIWKKFCH